MSSLPKISIVIQICGGLGNQLFQYLFAKANFASPQYQLIFDYSDNVGPNIKRPFVLDQLGLPGNFMHCQRQFFEKEGQQQVRFTNIHWTTSDENCKDIRQIAARVQKEDALTEQVILPPTENTAYFGYWQSYRYWGDPILLLQGVLKSIQASALYAQMLEQTQTLKIDSAVCAVHLRGGDYRQFLDYHGVCEAPYYEKAMVATPASFYHLYTDDAKFASEVLGRITLDRPIINTSQVIQDDQLEFLALLQYSKLIIPNSSFSYLAAWFAKAQYSAIEVTAPYPWFSFQKEGPDMPSDWQVRNRVSGNTPEEDQAQIKASTVTVVMPVHSRPEYLAAALHSVMVQTHLPSEIIFSQNVATDAVKAEVQRLKQGNALIKILDSQVPSLSLARNIGIQAATSDYIAFLDDDDIWEPNKIAVQLNQLIGMGASVVSCNYYEIDNSGQILSHSSYQSKRDQSWAQLLALENVFSGGSCVLADKNVFQRVGYFDDGMPACEDQDMWWRMALAREKLFFIEDSLVGIRKNTVNMSKNLPLMNRGHLIHLSKMLGSPDVQPADIQKQYHRVRAFLNNYVDGKPDYQLSSQLKRYHHLLGMKNVLLSTKKGENLSFSSEPWHFLLYLGWRLIFVICLLPIEIILFLKNKIAK